jgi:hypothetical protein
MLWFVMQAEELIPAEGHRRIHSSLIVAELDFVDARRQFVNDCTDLTALKALLWQFLHKRNHREEWEFAHMLPQSDIT